MAELACGGPIGNHEGTPILNLVTLCGYMLSAGEIRAMGNPDAFKELNARRSGETH